MFFLVINPLWPTYVGIKIGSLPILNFNRVIGLILVSVFLLNSLLSRAWLSQAIGRLTPVSKPIFVVFVFFIWRFISTVASKDIVYSLFLVTLDFLLQFVVFIAVVISFDDLEVVKKAFKAILISAVFVVLFGIVEHLFEKNIFTSLVPNSYKNVDFVASAIEEKVRDSYRVQVAFMHPLVLAEYLTIIIPIAGMFLLDKYSKFTRSYAFFVFIGGFYVLYSTGSRSGVVVLIMQFLCFFFFYLMLKSQNEISVKKIITGGSLFCISIFIGVFYGKDYIIGKGSAEVMSTAARVLQLLNGIEAVYKKPIMGYGQGFSAEYIGVENISTGQLTVDNYYLNLVVESGVPAVVLFVVMILVFLRYALYINIINSLFDRMASICIFSLLMGFTVFSFILSNHEAFGVVFSIFGLILVLYRISYYNVANNKCK